MFTRFTCRSGTAAGSCAYPTLSKTVAQANDIEDAPITRVEPSWLAALWPFLTSHADARHTDGTGGSVVATGWDASKIRIMYSLKLKPLRVALQRARHHVDSGIALTCKSRVPFRAPTDCVRASLVISELMLARSFVDQVMTRWWRNATDIVNTPSDCRCIESGPGNVQ